MKVNEFTPQPEDPNESVRKIAALWMAMAEQAGDIAHSKRRLYLAYLAEGFTEGQAIDLVRSF